MNLGDRVRHTISGFKGIATGMTEYINGCRQFLVEPESLDKDGKPIEGQWIDEQKLAVLQAGVHANPFAAGGPATAGGPDRARREGE